MTRKTYFDRIAAPPNPMGLDERKDFTCRLLFGGKITIGHIFNNILWHANRNRSSIINISKKTKRKFYFFLPQCRRLKLQ